MRLYENNNKIYEDAIKNFRASIAEIGEEAEGRRRFLLGKINEEKDPKKLEMLENMINELFSSVQYNYSISEEFVKNLDKISKIINKIKFMENSSDKKVIKGQQVLIQELQAKIEEQAKIINQLSGVTSEDVNEIEYDAEKEKQDEEQEIEEEIKEEKELEDTTKENDEQNIEEESEEVEETEVNLEEEVSVENEEQSVVESSNVETDPVVVEEQDKFEMSGIPERKRFESNGARPIMIAKKQAEKLDLSKTTQEALIYERESLGSYVPNKVEEQPVIVSETSSEIVEEQGGVVVNENPEVNDVGQDEAVLIEAGLLEPSVDNKEQMINEKTELVSKLYKEGKLEEAEKLMDEIRQLNSSVNELVK